jgi:predicted DCC family thiol-disulfide oxidoreductase YuxK
MSETLADRTPRATADDRAAATVFYDGACPVCRREIGWYRGMRGAERIEWRDIASEAPPEGFDREALLKRFTVIRGTGEVVSGAEGFAALWRGLRPTRWLGVLADRRPFLWIGEGLYRAFLRLRTAWR